jgi:hypothetical protein
MAKYRIHWFDLKSEKATDIIEASSEEQAIALAYTKYGGLDSAPAPLCSAELVMGND